LVLGSDKSRGYCLDDRRRPLGGAHLGKENPEVFLQPAVRFFKFLSGEERQKFVHHVTEKAS